MPSRQRSLVKAVVRALGLRHVLLPLELPDLAFKRQLRTPWTEKCNQPFPHKTEKTARDATPDRAERHAQVNVVFPPRKAARERASIQRSEKKHPHALPHKHKRRTAKSPGVLSFTRPDRTWFLDAR